MSNLPAVGEAVPNNWAAPEDWEQFRPLIKRLYVNEDRTLKEVMDIIARGHEHRGTIKMFKSRITKWGLDKNHKEREMRAVLRKKSQRDAIGKTSAIRIRGKLVDMEEVAHYFKRKGIPDPEADIEDTYSSTPPAVSIWTPSPSPSPEPRPRMDGGRNGQGLDCWRPKQYHAENWRESMVSYLAMNGQKQPPFYVINEVIRQSILLWPELHAGVVTNKIPRSPLPPHILLMHEKLFFNIKSYFRGSFQGGNFVKNNVGKLLNIKAKLGPQPLPRFFDCWYTEARSILAGSFVEGRQLLSRACELIENILEEEDPKLLEYLLDAYLHLSQILPEAARLLRNHTGELAEIIFPKKYPLREILFSFRDMDQSFLKEAIAKSSACHRDAFKEALDSFDVNYLMIYVNYINRIEELQSAELLFCNLIQESETKLEASDQRLVILRTEFARNLFHQGKHRETIDLMCDVVLPSLVASPDWIKIKPLRFWANCLYVMGLKHEAVMVLGEAVNFRRRCYIVSPTKMLITRL